MPPERGRDLEMEAMKTQCNGGIESRDERDWEYVCGEDVETELSCYSATSCSFNTCAQTSVTDSVNAHNVLSLERLYTYIPFNCVPLSLDIIIYSPYIFIYNLFWSLNLSERSICSLFQSYECDLVVLI